jgi:hypothetical protein
MQNLSKKSHPSTVLLSTLQGLRILWTQIFRKICNHKGEINREIRLIVILDKNTSYPLYFNYIPGNIVDNSFLQHIFNEMDTYDFDRAPAIMDFGYFSEVDLKFM